MTLGLRPSNGSHSIYRLMQRCKYLNLVLSVFLTENDFVGWLYSLFLRCKSKPSKFLMQLQISRSLPVLGVGVAFNDGSEFIPSLLLLDNAIVEI